MPKRRKIEGHRPLLEILKSHYETTDDRLVLRKAILDNCYFLDPAIVRQAENLPILRSRRAVGGEKKDSIVDGVFVSDNFPPDYVFRAATVDTRHAGSTHLCHIYGGRGEAQDTFFYTNLANLCLIPSFLSKLSDTNKDVVILLKECAFLLYGFNPKGEVDPRLVDRSMSPQITSPLSIGLAKVFAGKNDQRFLNAKKAGYLFGDDGKIQKTDPWVSDMIRRSQS